MELSATRQAHLARMKPALAKLPVWPFERQAAEEFGKVFAELRHLGENEVSADFGSLVLSEWPPSIHFFYPFMNFRGTMGPKKLAARTLAWNHKPSWSRRPIISR